MEENVSVQENAIVNVPNKNFGQLIIVASLFLLVLCVVVLFYQNNEINNKLKTIENSILDTKVVTSVPDAVSSFRSNSNKFEIILPLNWYKHEVDKLDEDWFTYPVDDYYTYDAGPDSKVLANLMSSFYKPVDDIKDDLIKRAGIGGDINKVQLYNPEKVENLIIGEKPGLFVISDDQKYAMALVDNGDDRYIFTLGTKDPSLVSIFKQILLSIKFID